MKYLKAYLSALLFNMSLMGALYFAINVYFRWSALADYFFFVCLVAAIGGPISVLLNKRKYENSTDCSN